MIVPPLSKSRFLAGLQCPLRLWHASYEPDLASPLSPSQKALFSMGHRVGELARGRYPGGVLIKEQHFRHDDAVRSTIEALGRSDVPAIYEGAFTFDEIRIRVDVLERSGDKSWNLIEVKSGTSVKEENVYDAALQYYVLDGVGLAVNRAGVLHLNRDYLYDGEKLDLTALFQFEDLGERLVQMQGDISEKIQDLKAMLEQKTPPAINASKHCRKPYRCEFLDHCKKSLPDHWIQELWGLRQDQIDELAMMEIVDIRDIPETLEMSALQRRIRGCVIRNAEHVDVGLGSALKNYDYPIHFLDFETVAPAIPRYANTHPFQMLPFQWSDHILSEDGTLTHQAYLCGEDKDPREEVAQTLLEALGEVGSICTYSNYENQVISELGDFLPAYRDRLKALLGRCRDLHTEIRKGYYHPEFHGSFSIKEVLPALVPAMSYAGLTVQEGAQAGFEYLRMIDPDTQPAERERIRRDLLEYSRQDTLAMVRIRDELLKRSEGLL
ncbi:MAG: DUF2779 domain-containing protein [Proteobacteria bacterium]|nr:DUF2779 domain-containing protein [Pseudomonadota bacterium]